MIIATNIENCHLYGDVIPSMHRLRYAGFKQRQNYAVPAYNGMEFDTYDTPATTYVLWRDEKNIVRGCARLFPTTLPYMIETVWPDAMGDTPLPKSPRIWEASRMCIDKSLPSEMRRRIHGEIICGLLETALENNLEWMIGVMSPPIWRSVFTSAGWPIRPLGPVITLPTREKIVVGRMDVSEWILSDIRRHFDIRGSVLAQTQRGSFFRKTA